MANQARYWIRRRELCPIFSLNYTHLYMVMCGYTNLQVPVPSDTRRRCQIPWSWSYRCYNPTDMNGGDQILAFCKSSFNCSAISFP